ncbi:Rid family hydrolase [Sphaerothrix gracilis]|uniref:Rid family hydrolase n=1 Tax=Sphaerothrix gracilis TaxID=3151835 RepID=UPI0031FBA74B
MIAFNQSFFRSGLFAWTWQKGGLFSAVVCLALMGLGWAITPAIADEEDDEIDEIEDVEDEDSSLPSAVTIYGNPLSSISSGVATPPDTALYFSSGTVPPTVDASFPVSDPTRYCGTALPAEVSCLEAQAFNTLLRIDELLVAAGLTKEDVIYVNAFLVPDPATGEIDWGGWFDAYSRYFFEGTPAEDNLPLKPSRTTLGVEGLVLEGWLIEISVIAAYPPEEGGMPVFIDITP